MSVTGFSHVTINVRDLGGALAFYVGTLGLRLVHRAKHDAYLEWGTAWLCLQETMATRGASGLGVDHVAFHLDAADFLGAVARLEEAHVSIVRGPVRRGSGWTVNFLDPDGTQLELHTSTLAERMQDWR